MNISKMSNKFVTSLNGSHLIATWPVLLANEQTTKVERMYIDECDNIHVVDARNKCVKVFNITGELLKIFPPIAERQTSTEAKHLGDLRYPIGVTQTGDITWLVDRDGGAIYGFHSDGRLVQYETGKPLKRPMCVTSNPLSQICYIINDEGATLLEYNPDDRTIVEVSDLNLKQFSSCLLLNDPGKLLLMDKAGYTGIYYLDKQKMFMKRIELSIAAGDLNCFTPGGACVDSNGLIYITDVNNNQILIFDEYMDYLTKLDTKVWFEYITLTLMLLDTKVIGPISGPIDVGITSSGLLVILEQAGRIKVFCHRKAMNPSKTKEKIYNNSVHDSTQTNHSRFCSIL